MGGRAVAVVAHRLGGLDGTSVVAAQWVAALQELGLQVVEVAGTFAQGGPVGSTVRRTVAALWAEAPGEAPPPLGPGQVGAVLADVDLVVVLNVWTLASAPAAALAIRDELERRRLPTIAYHMDLPGHQADRVDHPSFPVVPPWALHLALNRRTARDVAARTGTAVRVLHPRIDLAELRSWDRGEARGSLGIPAEDLLVVQPTRVVPRKRVDRGIALVRRLGELLDRPVRWWLTGAGEAGIGDEVVAMAAALPHPPLTGAAPRGLLYAAADLVALTSSWEGWGLPVVEAAGAGRMPVASPYPVLAEVHDLGVATVDPADVDTWWRCIGSRRWSEVVEGNARAAERLDSACFPEEVAALIERAAAGRTTCS